MSNTTLQLTHTLVPAAASIFSRNFDAFREQNWPADVPGWDHCRNYSDEHGDCDDQKLAPCRSCETYARLHAQFRNEVVAEFERCIDQAIGSGFVVN